MLLQFLQLFNHEMLLVLVLLLNLQQFCIEGSDFENCAQGPIDVREGSPVTLSCKAKAHNISTRGGEAYFWMFQLPTAGSTGPWIASSAKYNFRRNNGPGDLTIRAVDRQDAGTKFGCSWGTGTQKVKCGQAQLQVFWLKNATVQRKSPAAELRVNDRVQLLCSVDAYPKPTNFTWVHNGQTICNGSQDASDCKKLASVRTLDNTLVIDKYSQQHHIGIYHCFVQSVGGYLLTSHPYDLRVEGDTVASSPFGAPVIYARDDEPVTLKADCEDRAFFHLKSFGLWKDEKKTTMLSGKISNPDHEMNDNDKTYTFKNGSWRRLKTKLTLASSLVQNRHFFLAECVSSSGPQFFAYEILQAKAGNVDGAKNFEPQLIDNQKVVIGEGRNFTQHVYLQQHVDDMKWQPDPKIEWRDPNGRPIVSRDPRARVHISRAGDLVLVNVSRSMGGTYTVKIANMAGAKSFRLQLLVSFQPKLSKANINEEAKQFASLRLACGRPAGQVAPAPATNYQWVNVSNLGKLINISKSIDSVRIDNRTGDLIFDKIQLHHAGTYRCRAVTKLWYHTSFSHRDLVSDNTGLIDLKVKPRLVVCPKQKSTQILFNKQTMNVIDCTYKYSYPVNIRWFFRRRGENVFHDLNIQTIEFEGDNAKLKCHYARKLKHEGEYKIQVRKGEDEMEERIFNVTVGERAKFDLQPAGAVASVGDQIMMNCSVSGDPHPDIEWQLLNNDKQLFRYRQSASISRGSDSNRQWAMFSSDATVMANGSLVIRRVNRKHFGQYHCYAVTEFGSVSSQPVTVSSADELFYTGSQGSMTKTIVIVVSCAVGYLSLIVCLSVCCTVQLQRRRQKRGGSDLPGCQQYLGSMQQQQQQQQHQQTPCSSPVGAHFLNGYCKSADPGGCYESAGRSIPAEYKSLLSNATRDYTPPRLTNDLEMQPGSQYDCHSVNSCSAISSSFQSSYGRLRTNTPANSVVESTIDRVCRLHQIDRSLINYRSGILGRGLFGSVRVGTIRVESVVVKELATDDVSKQNEFGEQIKMFSKCDHDYVTKLIGVCIDTSAPPLLVLEYCDLGNLHELLQSLTRRNSPLPEECQLRMCLQVAQALEHFHSLGFVHADVGCRNILVTQEYNVKLTNIGPCLDRFTGQYVLNNANCLMPIRWLPPEALVHNQIGIKTDVWSFGIVAAEIFSMGQMPFAKLSDAEVLMLAEHTPSFRPDMPSSVPSELQPLLTQCWSCAPDGRPTAGQIVAHVAQLTSDLADV